MSNCTAGVLSNYQKTIYPFVMWWICQIENCHRLGLVFQQKRIWKQGYRQHNWKYKWNENATHFSGEDKIPCHDKYTDRNIKWHHEIFPSKLLKSHVQKRNQMAGKGWWPEWRDERLDEAKLRLLFFKSINDRLLLL